MSKPLIAALLGLLLALRALAAEPADLGQGLVGLRVRSLADSLPVIAAAVAESRPLVIDLRYATADAASAARLGETLQSRPAGALCLLLVSPALPAPVAAALTPLPVGIATLGIAGSQPDPTVVVQQSPAADRAAWDAAETGTPLATLVSGKTGKARYDEASLVKDFANGNHAAAPPAAPALASLKDPAPAATPAPPVDRVLQRAIHLHRTLLAIRAR